ncbi:MAG TPA: Na(+)-translocating NADH-quinone reductase subunit C, partial [Gammaproteobacteria bacterium]|nr:Na(+)-translocating NADH-quinone reductase subunit C [Gammaproteobacteria bacterium]
MNKNDTLLKTLFVGISVCLFCSIIISTAAVELRGLQQQNKLKDQQSKILSSAGLLTNEISVDKLFSSIEEKIINLETGEYEDSLDP